MPIDLRTYVPKGDKKSSDFFHEYLPKIYARREASGLQDLLQGIRALVVQVDAGDALPYLEELYVMTPYRLRAAYRNSTHRILFLTSEPAYPQFVVLEPLHADYEDDTTRLNLLYPRVRATPNARYVGEILHTKDLRATVDLLVAQNTTFHSHGEETNAFFANPHFAFTYPSDFTFNRVGYTDSAAEEVSELRCGDALELTPAERGRLDRAHERAMGLGFEGLILGVDHMATRILAGEREDAILEFLTLSPYYFWGAYNISDQNSSTNVTRNGRVDDDKLSPAKVFTANNTPSFVNTFENLPMPTEDFVRNFGRRMHHVAYEVKDGDHPSGVKNIDYVVGRLRDEEHVAFLAHVVGECKDEPNLKQIFSKHSRYSILITEYVERCMGYDGFFTKDNVAALTAAAGEDERYDHGAVFD